MPSPMNGELQGFSRAEVRNQFLDLPSFGGRSKGRTEVIILSCCTTWPIAKDICLSIFPMLQTW
jgi:hypothetical protein